MEWHALDKTQTISPLKGLVARNGGNIILLPWHIIHLYFSTEIELLEVGQNREYMLCITNKVAYI